MHRLSLPIESIKPHYTVVVIGSGYGAAIAASRMSRAGQSVCVLERGKEFQPGEYPASESEALREWQVDAPEGHLGSRTGLFDLHSNPDLNVMTGCGLGGTSLINANVSLEADRRVFNDPCWPPELRQAADQPFPLEEYYARARAMLRPSPYPETPPDFPSLPKLAALRAAGESIDHPVKKVDINVHFGPAGTNHVGVHQEPCILCGDCCSGCNHHAKNTILMNYLPDAANHGAEIFTCCSVRYLERKDCRWVVHFELLDVGRERFLAPDLFVTADVVVLGAGALGSTEILLRSRARGLAVSDRLGRRLTGNGDVLAFAYNTEREIDGIGHGVRKREDMQPVGPCITGMIDLRDGDDVNQGMVIQEGSIPGALAGLLPAAFMAASAMGGEDRDTDLAGRIRRHSREMESMLGGAYRGAVRNTHTYLVMTHDDGEGRMQLQNDRLCITWPGVGRQEIFDKVDAALDLATKPLGGRFVQNPIWTRLMGHRLITVHPLGGCAMGIDGSQGVVNHKGQVFSGSEGAAVYENLYVADGSVVPRPVGVNPLLTISAIAERTCALLAQDRGWTFDTALAKKAAAMAATSRTLGLRFTETMRGYLEIGKNRQSFEFTLTISSADLDAMLTRPGNEARISGTVTAPALSPEALMVTDGVFNLFVADPDHVETRLMKYRMNLTAQDGKRYHFYGFKKVHEKHLGVDMWPDTSTLYITVWEGSNDSGAVIGTGVLRIQPVDFAKQMTTLEVTNASSTRERLQAVARFGNFFGGTLFQTYGGIFSRNTAFQHDAAPRKKRELRAGSPELHPFDASDGVALKLTRYQGGSKGPVILSHGLGVSSSIFSIDTIETNLVEYLYASGYDVWLMDNRASIDLPSAEQRSTADDVAMKDYPAAVGTVRALTGANKVDMVVHCYGSTTFTMAMLGGLEGVRSAVCSQVGTDIVAHPLTRFKTGIHVPGALDKLGVKSLTAMTTEYADWPNRLFNTALRLYPIEHSEHCTSDVCHRITFLYSLLYEHAQLNEGTHAALHEMFGVANIGALEHLAMLVRKQRLVDADGADVYMPHLKRLAIPITFLHGDQNHCFLPESTARTMERLEKENGASLYRRHLIPGYGHIDCIFGKNAATDVFPFILEHLEAHG